METPVKYGIIGCGMMGREHMENIRLVPGARVAAIYEPDETMAQAAKAAEPMLQRADSIEALLDMDIDALVIASPNHLHLGQLEAIAAHRALPTLVEKPLFTDPADAARLAALRDGYGAPIWVAMEYRYMPPVATFLEQLDQATGGLKMLSIREHRFPFLQKVGNWNRFNRYSGGTLVEKCCHFFDLMRLAMPSDPVRVMCSAGQTVNHRDEIYDGERSDIWDSAFCIVDFADGARAMLDLCMFAEGSKFQEEICGVGPEGKIEAFVPGPGRFWPTHLGEPPTAQVVVSPRSPKGPQAVDIPVDPKLLAAGDHNGSTFYQHSRFNAVVRGEGDVDVTLHDGWAAVTLGLAAQDSARSGNSVAIDLSAWTQAETRRAAS